MTRLLTTTVSARHNPFASHHVEAIPFRFASGDLESNLERLRAMNWRGAIVGNQGSGKTTLMLELKIWLSAESVTRTDIEYCFVSRNPEDRSEELDRLLDAA
jgi:ABC-type bacteriocin/lantibiotic exporter with double-glycine peptidase domain